MAHIWDENESFETIVRDILLSQPNHNTQNVIIYGLSLNCSFQWVSDLYFQIGRDFFISISEYDIISIISWSRSMLIHYKEKHQEILSTLSSLIYVISPAIHETLLANTLGDLLELDEIQGFSGSTVSAQQARLILEMQGSTNEDEIYYFHRYKKSDLFQMNDIYHHDYVVIPIEIDDSKVGVLEIFNIDLLIKNNFESFETWKQYLTFLERSRVIQIVDVINLNNKNIVVIYEFPNGYRSLSEYFEELHATDRNSIQFLEAFNKLIGLTKGFESNSNFQYLTVNSDYIFVKLLSNVFLSCIGASLDSVPRYVVSASHIESENEDYVSLGDIGIQAYSLFLGYLFIELLIGKNPLLLQEQLRKLKDRTYLSQSDEFSSYASHVRGLLTRLANSNPDYRYHDTHAIELDLKHILSFYEYIETHSEDISEDNKNLYEFINYMILRLNTHRRNPELAGSKPDQRIDYLVKYVSDDIYRFAPQKSYQYAWLISKLPEIDPLSVFNQDIWQWMSIPSKQLIIVILFWNNCVDAYLNLPETEDALVLMVPTLMLLAEAIKLERMAFVQTTTRSNTDVEDQVRIDELSSDDYRLIARNVPPPIYGQELRLDSEEIKNLIHTYQYLHLPAGYQHFELDRYLTDCYPSIIFSLLVSHSLILLDKDDRVVWTSSDISTNANSFISSNLMFVAFHRNILEIMPTLGVDGSYKKDEFGKPIAFFASSSELPKTANSDNFTHINLIKKFREVVHELRNTKFSNRSNGKVIDYSPEKHGVSQGLLRRQYNETMQPFDARDLIKIPKVKGIAFALPDHTTVTVDSYEIGNQNYIGAILTTPLNLFVVFKSYSTSTIDDEVQPMRNKVFISYAHKDERDQKNKWIGIFEKRVKNLEKYEIITKKWSDSDIEVSQIWSKEIDEAIETAKVAILLIDEPFFSSDFIRNNELKPIFEAHQNGLIKVIPVACSSGMYDEYDKYLAGIQFANDPNDPLDLLSEPEQYKQITEIMKMVVKAFKD